MLKKISIFALIILVLSIVSCNRKEGSSGSIGPVSAGMEEMVAEGKWKMGFVLRVNSGLYSLEEDTGSKTDKTRWVAGLNLGDSIMIGDIREATFSGDNRVYDFVEVRDSTGREGISFVSQIAVAGNLAVVTDDRAHLYKTPNAVDVTGTTLSRKTVLVYYPETASNGYVEIRAYDPFSAPNPAYRHGNFIRLSSISEKRDDINSSILLQTALPLSTTDNTQRVRREALLESALLDYPNSVFRSEINELINPVQEFDDTSLGDDHDNEGYYLDD